MRRVVITGAGTVNALGMDCAATFEALREGRSAVGELELHDRARLGVTIGAQVQGWDPAIHLPRARPALYDRFTQFTLKAATEAVAQSGLVFDEALALASGVVFGTAAGGVTTWDESYREVYEAGKARVHPFVVPRLMNSAAASHVSIEWGLRGPVFSVSTACASSNHAMALAFQMVRSGAAEVMVTGGAEAMLSFGGLKAWEGLRVMSPSGCRPFCASRDGMVLGEGAGVFVFEALEHARARGAEILAEVAGAGMSADAADIVLPSAEGARRAVRGALRDAGLAPDRIGYINAHGTGTLANDRIEAQVIRDVFGAVAPGGARATGGRAAPMVSSTKPMHGHVIGGTGAIELLACLMALREGVIAPLIGHRRDDPDCAGLDLVLGAARERRVEAVLSHAFAFGGLNAVIALRRI